MEMIKKQLIKMIIEKAEIDWANIIKEKVDIDFDIDKIEYPKSMEKLDILYDKFWAEYITHNKNEKITSQDFLNKYIYEMNTEDPEYIWLSDSWVFYKVSNGENHDLLQVWINLWLSNKKIKESIWYWKLIPKYKKLYYWNSPQDWDYNLLRLPYLKKYEIKNFNEVKEIVNIKYLISNVLWNKEENIEWFERALLYKIDHIDDHMMPWVVLYGKGWTWKGTLMTFLWQIFWEWNVQANLWQSALTWWFDVYTWEKLVVEFAEIQNYNTNHDKLALNKLKNLIMAKEITVNRKYAASYTANNIAWFFISSNSDRPLMLDSEDKWNRRFTIIKTGDKIERNKVEDIYRDIYNKDIIGKYIWYLRAKHGKIEKIQALENQDKKDLIENNKSDTTIFFDSLYKQFWWKRVSANQISQNALIFCDNNWLDHKHFMRYIRNEMPDYVWYKMMRFWSKIERWYEFKEYDGRFDYIYNDNNSEIEIISVDEDIRSNWLTYIK